MKTPDCTLIYNSNGTINYDKTIDKDSLLSRKSLKALAKYENTKDTGLSHEKAKSYYDYLNKRHKQDRVISRSRKRGRKKEQQEVEIDDTDETGIKKRPIEYEESALSRYIKENPDVFRSEILFEVNKRYENYSPAQLINSIEWTTQYGKIGNKQTGNTRVGKNISRLPIHTFGSISDYQIDTSPLSHVKCKGTEITFLTDEQLRHKGKHLIRRRFLSEILSYWCYVLGIRYQEHEGDTSGIEIWTRKITLLNTFGQPVTEDFLKGEDAIQMLRDIVILTRNTNPNKLMKLVKQGKVSENLYNILHTLRFASKTTTKNVLKSIKDRIFVDYQLNDKVWSFPKYRIDYINILIRKLQSGEYFTDILVPIVHDLRKYPIECKDTHLKPMDDEQHKKNLDDYNIGQYIWERD